MRVLLLLDVTVVMLLFRRHHHRDRNLLKWRHHNNAKDTNTNHFSGVGDIRHRPLWCFPLKWNRCSLSRPLPPPYFAPLALVNPSPAFSSRHLVFFASYSSRKKIQEETNIWFWLSLLDKTNRWLFVSLQLRSFFSP